MESQIGNSCTALPDAGQRKLGALDRSERVSLRPELLTYRRLRPRDTGLADVGLIGEAYRCWSNVWSQTLLELDGVAQVPSDEFTRQDEIGAIFYGYECIALSCFRWVDLSSPMHHDDSYFQAWPWSARAAACRDGQRICIGSHITIAPAWRRTSLKAVLTALTLDRFSASDCDAVVGTMRDDRGMAKMVERLGAHTLGHAQLHNVPVTLIAFYRSSVRPPLSADDEKLVRGLGADLLQRAHP